MNDTVSMICEIVLLLLIGAYFIHSVFNKDKTRIWSPITTISITYTYYCLMPYWGGVVDRYKVDESLYNGYIFHIAALLSFVCILIGFYMPTKIRVFERWNRVFNENNAGKYGVILTIIGIIGYASVRGFHLFIAAPTSAVKDMAIGGFVYYLMMMLDMLAFASGLILVGIKHGKRNMALYIICFWLIFVHFLIAGARWRIVVAVIALLTTNYLYPRVKRVNVPLVIALALVMYMGFSVMDKARKRGSGIDMEVAQSLEYDDIKGGAGENSSVYSFSLMCMGRLHDVDERIFFQPVITALLMPIPRSLFPWKPDAKYLHSLEMIVLGNADGGAAYLNFVESFYSFGWLGVIFWAWFLGWLSRRFWDNYLLNQDSIGAIIALGVYSGFCYVAISRGYLAATFTTFIIALCLPFWIIQLWKRFFG